VSIADALAEIIQMEEHARAQYEARMLVLKKARLRLQQEWAPGCHPRLQERAARRLP
jgi:hypothetical protein